MKIDVCSVTQGDERYYSFMSLNYGIIADCDLSTEHLRYLSIYLFFFIINLYNNNGLNIIF